MDRTLARVLGALLAALILAAAAMALAHYAVSTYRATLSGTYDYEVRITPAAPLRNVTLYIPIPAKGAEKSLLAEEIGAGRLRGLPAGWSISLIGTEKVTLLEVTAAEMNPPGSALSVKASTRNPIATREAATGDLVIDALAGKRPVPCGAAAPAGSPTAGCLDYRGRIYASGEAGDASVLTIALSLRGSNTWDVFGPSSNEYRDTLAVTVTGEPRGWYGGDGTLVTGIGDYGMDFWVKEP